MDHEVQGAFGPDGLIVSRVPAHQDLVVPQSQLPAPEVAALLGGDAPLKGSDLQVGAALADLQSLAGVNLGAVLGGLPGGPPIPGDLEALLVLAGELVET